MSEMSLSQLPDIPLNYILQFLDYQSLQILRKVCLVLRNFIDDVIPSSSINTILVRVFSDTVHWKFLENEKWIKVKYIFHKNGCIVIRTIGTEKQKARIENEDFLNCFWRDFEIALRHQKTILEEFQFIFYSKTKKMFSDELENSGQRAAQLFEKLKNSLESRIHSFRTKNLEFEVTKQIQLLSILPYIDLNFIEKLTIWINRKPSNDDQPINTDLVVCTDQWKNAKTCGIFYIDNEKPATDLFHVSIGKLNMKEISGQNVIALKNEFISFATFRRYDLFYEIVQGNGTVSEQLASDIGHADGFDATKSSWYFRMLQSTDILSISCFEMLVVFERVESNNIPNGITIR